MPDDLPLHRFSEFAALPPEYVDLVQTLGSPPRSVAKFRTIRREGQPVQDVYLLTDGWAASSITLPDGNRQILKIHLPGDVMGAPSMAFTAAVETLSALSPVTIRTVKLDELFAFFARAPRMAAVLMLSAQRERVALMDSLASIGRTSAASRLAAMLIDLGNRLARIGMVQDDRFALWLTQEHIGDLLGLTPVHVNRTLRDLEAGGLIARHHRVVTLLDRPGLIRLAARPQRTLVKEADWLPQSG